MSRDKIERNSYVNVRIGIPESVFVGTKGENPYSEVIDDFRNAKKIRVLTYSIWTEKANDGVKYKQVAGQEDFDRF